MLRLCGIYSHGEIRKHPSAGAGDLGRASVCPILREGVRGKVTPELNRIYQGDCLDFMREWPDRHFDLVLTDPPYGIDYGGRLKGKGDGHGGADKNGWKDYGAPNWDKERPGREFFDEMRRVSKHQVIWGGNYFADMLPATMGWLVWDKGQREFFLPMGSLPGLHFTALSASSPTRAARR